MTTSPITNPEGEADDVERDIRAAIWNGLRASGLNQELALIYIRAIMAEPLMSRALSALRSPNAGDGWQPIETAPKDETSVDLWVQGEGFAWRVPNAWWCPRDEAWITADADYGEPGSCIGPMDRATFWRAVPEPPLPDATPALKEATHEGRG